MSDKQTIWMTQDAYTKLQEELDYLKGEGRSLIAKKIGAAKAEGDLSENGGYHAARENRASRNCGSASSNRCCSTPRSASHRALPDEVTAGSTVTVAYDGDFDDTDVFLLGSREMTGGQVGGHPGVQPSSRPSARPCWAGAPATPSNTRHRTAARCR